MTEQRQRVERMTQEATQRRRRADGTIDSNLSRKLLIPQQVEARMRAEGLTPRWANDEGNRLHNLTVNDDYDKVDDVAPVPVGTSKDGKPIMAHLLAKKTEFIADDRGKAEQRRREAEQAAIKGPPDGNPNPAEGQVYADKANSIGRENRIIE
ncbi:MAG: hypothetical protein V4696_10205 [Pseudomonadota bacterium]